MSLYRIVFLIFCLLCTINSIAQDNRKVIVEWLGTTTPGMVGKNEMVELRIIPDSETTNSIRRFISSKAGDQLNPFNPEQLDIQCQFWVNRDGKWYGPEKRFGFYYEDYIRDTTTAIESWTWRRDGPNHELRVRFTPRYTGEWLCRTVVIINKKDTIKAEDLTFNCTESDHTGFLSASHGKYFEVDGKTFMPMGTNLSHPRWINDPDELRQGISEYNYELRKRLAMPAAFVNYQQDIRNLAESGGNYFRMMLFPFVNDIEFEHLNNYSNRMHLAWEMDETFRVAEENDIRVHFVLTWGCEFMDPELSYNKVFWNWYPNDYPWVEDDFGSCYQHELGLKEPHEFLTDERALRFYQYKLRYIISRWGYSTSIGIVELINEINQVFKEYPNERMLWQARISRYLKEDLGLVQPISVNYAGKPNLRNGDTSYYLNTVDVITFNEYRVPDLRENFIEYQLEFNRIGKPFMFSEIGAGSSELGGCEKYSEWRKDAWMTTFSGMSAMGMEWAQQRNTSLFKNNFPVLQNFISDINWQEFESFAAYRRGDKKVEMVAIKDNEGNRAVGVIQNLTWNFYTNRQNEEVPCARTVPEKRYRNYVGIPKGEGAKSMKLKGFGKKKKLKIDFYNTENGALIESRELRSNHSGKLKIPYPELKGNQNLIAFKLYPADGTFGTAVVVQMTNDVKLPADNSVGEVQRTNWN